MNKVTIFEQACNQVEGFEAMGEYFIRQLGNRRGMSGLNQNCRNLFGCNEKSGVLS